VQGHRVDDIERTAGGVQVTSGGKPPMTGSALIGADGVWSTVASRHLRAPLPRFTGRTAARVLLPVAGLPPPFNEPVTGLWIGPKAHLVHYPVDGGKTLNLVAIVEGGPSVRDWGLPIASGEPLQGFAGWHPMVLDILAHPASWRRWSLVERDDLATWCDGPVTLLGDAAHPVLPFLAQGAVLALEDAVTLASAVAAQPRNLATAFASYAAVRRSRAVRVAAASRRNGRIYHLAGLAAGARDIALSSLPASRLLSSHDWLYGYRCPDIAPEPANA
jgi:salicylate hydroxylase